MSTPLSFSAYKKYHDCPRLYKYHYVDKDRVDRDTSALKVGNIVDDAIMLILEGRSDTAHKIIADSVFAHSKSNVEFYPDDFDADLIDLTWASAVAAKHGWKGDNIKAAIVDMLKDQSGLSVKQRKVLNEIVWACLEIKILAMVESFEKWILPQIDQVHEIQLHLDDGVTHGYLDFTATLKDGRKVLFDVKTSKRNYEADAVKKSPQLSLYAAMHDYEYAGFIVLNKTLSKNKLATCKCGFKEEKSRKSKCPDCGKALNIQVNPTSYSQLLVDKVPDWNKALTKEAMNETIDAINKGVFPRNLNTCFWLYGRQCAYVNKCWGQNE